MGLLPARAPRNAGACGPVARAPGLQPGKPAQGKAAEWTLSFALSLPLCRPSQPDLAWLSRVRPRTAFKQTPSRSGSLFPDWSTFRLEQGKWGWGG